MTTAEKQGELWGARAEDWAFKTEPASIPFWQAILDSAQVGKGTRLLDIGCGGGGLTVLAAERGAMVQGFDASQALLDIAQKRVPDGKFTLGDCQQLPFDDGSFDVVTACNCIQFADDQRLAVMEAKRVLKPGGKFVIGMWCEMDRTDMRFIFQAVGMVAPPAQEENHPPTLSIRENLIALIRSGGLHVLKEAEVETPFIYESVEDAWIAFRSAGVIIAITRSIGEEKLKAAVLPVIEKFEQPDGKVRLANCFRYLVCE